MVMHINSEGERIEIVRVGSGRFEGMPLLVIHDDPPPRGSGIQAPMLLDEGTREWLAEQLLDLEDQDDREDG